MHYSWYTLNYKFAQHRSPGLGSLAISNYSTALPSCTLYRVQVRHLEDAHLSIYLTCPSSGALALVLVKGQQAADALVGAGVVGVTRGVLGRLAVLPSEAQRADTGGAAGHGHTRWHGHGTVPSIQAVSGVTGVLVVAVLAHEPRGAPETHTYTQTWMVDDAKGICQHKDVALFLAPHRVERWSF